MDCGNCRREIRGERASCLYCGWTKTEGLAAATAARPVAGSEDPRTFRAGATTWRFLIWALAALTAGLIILRRGSGSGLMSDPRARLGVALVLFVLGPLAFGAQLLRTTLVKVTVDPQAGLLLRSGELIPWGEIEGIQYAGLRSLSGQGIIVFLLDIVRALIPQGRTYGLWGAVIGLLRIGLIAIVWVLIVIVAVLTGVLLPVLMLLSPWEPRVIVCPKNGQPLVWRDLRDEADFVHGVEAGIRRAGDANADIP